MPIRKNNDNPYALLLSLGSNTDDGQDKTLKGFLNEELLYKAKSYNRVG